jgi:hypothetical protein
MNDIQQFQKMALLRSAVSMAKQYAFRQYGHVMSATTIDELREIIDKLAARPNDPTDWEEVKHEHFYDDYLDMREKTGTLHPHDLVRPGLVRSNFISEVEYHKHAMRVAESRAKEEASQNSRLGFKFCNGCEQDKPIAAFKKRGGAICNACRCKAYRQRKLAKKQEASPAPDA